jgi:hypothetical protein
MTTDAEQIRAHLDHDVWAESLTEQEGVRVEMRRKILGGLDDTAALNRVEAR